jgi:hypothetical protein
MVGRQESFYGNILLYDYLSKKRAPVLLNRNLTRALRVHRHLSENTSSRGRVVDNHALRPLWHPPTWDSLDEMVDHERSKGSFVLEIHGIRSIARSNARRLSEHVEPARKARALLRAKSTVQVAIFSPLSDLPSLSKSAQDATLQSTARQVGGTVAVETARIIIDPRDFGHDNPWTGTNGVYKMNISININSQGHAEDLYSHLALEHVSKHDPSTRLSTTWANILKCPTEKVVLPLRDWQDSLDLGLEVSMYWTSVAGESILTIHNRNLHASRIQPDASPTPPSHPNTGHSTVKLIFVYANETIQRDELSCPHEGCQRRKPTDIDDLRMHLDSWHDYLRYKAIKQNPDASGVETWVFKCEVSDHRAHRAEQRASARADEPADVRIIPPPEPFNQRQYLEGDNDDYRRMSRVNKQYTAPRTAVTVPTSGPISLRRKSPDQVQNKSVREKKRYPVPEAPAGITFFRSCSRRPLRTGECISESDDEVDDSWIKLRKAAEFDKEEYLTDPVKRFLKAFDSHMWDEQLQSDVHVGDALVRFTRENCHWIWQERVFQPLTEKLNELLQDNIISKEVHTGCLEIVENARPDLTEEGNRLSQRLSQIEVRPTSHEELYDDPRLSNTRSPELTPSANFVSDGRKGGSRQTRVDKGKSKGKAKVTDTGHLTPITADSDGDLEMREATLGTEVDFRADEEEELSAPLPYDLCFCGRDAQASTRKSPMIACASMVSTKIHDARVRCCILTLPGLYTKKLSL